MSTVDDLDPAWCSRPRRPPNGKPGWSSCGGWSWPSSGASCIPATADTGVATHNPDTTLPGVLGLDESLGGDGTPAVAAFTPEPFAAAMGCRPAAGARLLADALDLTHRLPRLWARVQALQIPAWQARRAAQHTHQLSLEAARWVDDRLADRTGCGPILVDRLVADAIARFDPEEHARREDQGKASWDVELVHPAPTEFAGTSELHARGDTLDLTKFYDLVCDTAAPAPRPRRHRRARRPQGQSVRRARRPRRTARPPSTCAALVPTRRAGKVRLYLHVDADDLDADQRGRDVERLGPATIAKIKDWVGHAQVTIQPVLDMGRGDAVDQHDPPAWMREIVILRDRHCVFPGCRVDARCLRPGPHRPLPRPRRRRTTRPNSAQRTSPASADATTEPRPPASGDTNAPPTATATSGTDPTVRRTSSPPPAPSPCPPTDQLHDAPGCTHSWSCVSSRQLRVLSSRLGLAAALI